MKKPDAPNHVPPEAIIQGASGFSKRAAEMASIIRPLPAMIHHDPHPKPRKTLHPRA